jgi:hypothetical protein
VLLKVAVDEDVGSVNELASRLVVDLNEHMQMM